MKGEEGGWVGGLDANTEWRRNASQTNNDPSHQGAPLLAYNINVIFIACIDYDMVGVVQDSLFDARQPTLQNWFVPDTLTS